MSEGNSEPSGEAAGSAAAAAAPATPTRGSIPSALLHTEVKSYGGHKVEFHVADHLNADTLELISFDCDTCSEYERNFFVKSLIMKEVENAAQKLLTLRVDEMQVIRSALPADTDFSAQDAMLLSDLHNKLAGEYIIARTMVDFKSDASPGCVKISPLEGDIGADGLPLNIVAVTPEGRCDLIIKRKTHQEENRESVKSASMKISTKSSKERKRRHTIKEVMAEHAMEVIGSILGLPSKDASDEAGGGEKTASTRQRRHTTETNPTRRKSVGSSRRSSKDNSRPPSGSSKYDLDAPAQHNIRKKSARRPTSVKEKMVAHTVEAVSNAVEGVKSILISPSQVGVQPTTSEDVVIDTTTADSRALPVADPTIAPVVSPGPTEPQEPTDQQEPLRSNDSLLNPTESVAEAVPVSN